MKYVALDGNSEPDFSNHLMVLPSCGSNNVDQLCIDIICFNFGKLIGRIISDNLDFISSPNPYDLNSNILASAVDVYKCELPKLGNAIVLRVAASLPKAKRQIRDYSLELLEFATQTKIEGVFMLRSVSSVFCNGSQIADWPNTVRAEGSLNEKLNIKPIEEYGETEEMLKAAVYGELYECIKKFAKIPFSTLFYFIHEGIGPEQAKILIHSIAGGDDLKYPPSWASLINE